MYIQQVHESVIHIAVLTVLCMEVIILILFNVGPIILGFPVLLCTS